VFRRLLIELRGIPFLVCSLVYAPAEEGVQSGSTAQRAGLSSASAARGGPDTDTDVSVTL
jgi:hypothetical protein